MILPAVLSVVEKTSGSLFLRFWDRNRTVPSKASLRLWGLSVEVALQALLYVRQSQASQVFAREAPDATRKSLFSALRINAACGF